MSNPTGPHDPGNADDATTDIVIDAAADPATEIIGTPTTITDAVTQPVERRYTAPSSFDDSTRKIDRPVDPETEVFAPPEAEDVAPQHIPARDENENAAHPPSRRSWGWVLAVVLVIAALAAIAVLATVLLTRNSSSVTSTHNDQEDNVRAAIQSFDTAIQRGDLSALRSITCGTTKDNYVNYDQQAWDETQANIAESKQYQVVSSIDQVVITGDHALANVTTYVASTPQNLSSRSFDLQRQDNQWKICQAPTA